MRYFKLIEKSDAEHINLATQLIITFDALILSHFTPLLELN
jgi:hypothetical protein